MFERPAQSRAGANQTPTVTSMAIREAEPQGSATSGLPGGSVGEESTCNAGAPGDASSVPGTGRFPLEEERAPHSSILAWRILWPEEPGGLQSVGVAKSRKGKARPARSQCSLLGPRTGRKACREAGVPGETWSRAGCPLGGSASPEPRGRNAHSWLLPKGDGSLLSRADPHWMLESGRGEGVAACTL